MPIFEYKCQQCGHVMEILQKSRKASKQICAQCGSSDTKKVLSGFAVGQGKAASSACGAGSCPGGMCPM